MDQTKESKKMARLFLGFSVPQKAKNAIHTAMSEYPKYIESRVPEDNWHITLLFLGEIEHYHGYKSRISKPLPQTFLPTITVTHVGRGYMRDQLWAFCNPSPTLLNIHADMDKRMRKMRWPFKQKKEEYSYAPHITLAHFFPIVRSIGVPDTAVNITFPVKELLLYESHRHERGVYYEPVSTISLMP